jgi:hypothetical protein
MLLRCQADGKGGCPKVAVKVLDSILSRDDAAAPTGDMIHLGAGVDLAKVSWRVGNSVYAGWKQLLASESKSIAWNDLDSWHNQWLYREGDRVVPDTWPSDPPSGLAERSAGVFFPGQLPVAYAALTDLGSIGCVIGRLPATPEAWLKRTFKFDTVPVVPASDLTPPPIESVFGFYGGERIDLAKVPDLGKYLNDKLDKVNPASRVVIHVAGKGLHQTGPLRVKGTQHLVLFFERDAKDPITLEPNAAAGFARGPLFEVAGGHLELIGARLRLSPTTPVPKLVQVQGGNLTLSRCALQGPHARSIDSPFQHLIDIGNSGPEPTTLLVRDSILIAGKLLIRMEDNVQLQARNNVFLALGDGVQFDVNAPSARLLHLLDHNTFAARQAFLTLKPGPEFQAAEPVTLNASSNAFLQPFVEDADKGPLLRGAESWVASGKWSWRGSFNVYDSRLHAYFGRGNSAGGKQTKRDWQSAWGKQGEQDPLLLPAAAAKTIGYETATQSALFQQLDRLALPAELRGDPDQTPPGANLVGLGIKKK